MVNDALIGTTEYDTFSVNPATCTENWRTHESYRGGLLPAIRGAAYLDDSLFRGTTDGLYWLTTSRLVSDCGGRGEFVDIVRTKDPQLPHVAGVDLAERREAIRRKRSVVARPVVSETAVPEIAFPAGGSAVVSAAL
jgi:hypothetical protein